MGREELKAKGEKAPPLTEGSRLTGARRLPRCLGERTPVWSPSTQGFLVGELERRGPSSPTRQLGALGGILSLSGEVPFCTEWGMLQFSLPREFTHSLIRSFTHSFIHSLIHSFIDLVCMCEKCVVPARPHERG